MYVYIYFFSGDPLTWVGYEVSPYCVAKTLVIWTMLVQEADANEILQVYVCI